MTTPRRPRVWVDLTIDSNLAANGSFALDLLANQVVDWQARTVVRSIGRLFVCPSVVANSTISIQDISLGIGVMSATGFAATGGPPDPSVDTEIPTNGWLYRDRAALVNQQDSGTVEAFRFPEFHWDIRAGRKVDRGVLFIVGVNKDLMAGTTAVKVSGLVRSLVLI